MNYDKIMEAREFARKNGKKVFDKFRTMSLELGVDLIGESNVSFAFKHEYMISTDSYDFTKDEIVMTFDRSYVPRLSKYGQENELKELIRSAGCKGVKISKKHVTMESNVGWYGQKFEYEEIKAITFKVA